MRHYSHHIGDFDRATRHLTRIERSIYRDMLDVYYDTEQPLTLDLNALCRKIIARSPEEVEAAKLVLAEFFHETPNGWFHDRCEEEIAAYRKNQSQAAAAGKASAAARAARREAALAGTRAEPEANISATDVQPTPNDRSTSVANPLNDASTNRKPVTSNQKPVTPKNKATPAALPDWLPQKPWDDFVAMRKKNRKPLTDEAMHLLVGKLDLLRAEGHDPAAVLNQSTMNGWQGVFALRSGERRESERRSNGRPSINDFPRPDDEGDPFDTLRRA